MIAAREVTLHIDGRTLLERITFDAQPGEFVAVLGPNGVGKTTLLRAIAGTRAIASGSLRVGNRDIATLGAAERARTIAFMASDDVLAEHLVVRDVVATGRYPYHRWWEWRASPRDEAIIESALRAVRMETFADRSFDTLSSGERQRIWLALGLAQEAPVLLLDEPTSHLDVRVAHDILALLRDQVAAQKTVVCVLHDLNEAAEFADRIGLLCNGRLLAFDTPEAVLTSPLLEAAYGTRMETVRTLSNRLRVFPCPARHGASLDGPS